MYPPKPCYLSPLSDLFKILANDRDWIAERKINGRRCEVVADGINGVKFYTRQGNLLFMRQESNIKTGTILDGELEFKTKILYIFDAVMWAGNYLTSLPLYQRRNILKMLTLDNDMRILEWVEADIIASHKFFFAGLLISLTSFPFISHQITSYKALLNKELKMTRDPSQLF